MQTVKHRWGRRPWERLSQKNWTDWTGWDRFFYVTAHQLQAAKQQFSAVADKAARGIPQLVTKHGKPFVVIVGADDWNRSRPTGGGIWDALRACPVDLGGLNITRNKDLSRHVAL